MREYIVKIGRFWSTVLFTVISIVMSLLLTTLLVTILIAEISSTAIIASITVPAIVAPITAWIILGLVIKLHYLEEEQRKLASFDHLTGVMSRRTFLENTNTLMHQAIRNNQVFSIAIIDLDDFKAINDEYGHGGGDAVLKSFADVLSGSLRKSDLIGRLGGEEFAITLFNTNEENAQICMEKLRNELAKDEVLYLQRTINYTVSIGVAEFSPALPTDIDNIIQRADKALYQVKTTGKNGVKRASL